MKNPRILILDDSTSSVDTETEASIRKASATPFASGVAALLAAAKPGTTPARIRSALTGTAVKLAGTWLPAGSGRIDAVAALGTVRGQAVDVTGPVATITRGAASGAHVANTSPYGVRATDPSGVTRIELIVNGTVVQRATGSAYTFAVPVWKFGKVARVQARAFDRLGNVRFTPTRTWYR